ncbi:MULTISPECIES: NAD(P)-binding domain-containing protein [Kitasatospora]|uniref:Putative oxidoreductase n=1 Tax=Kitasatospora setae (strain ATCC 33774 / DSM 43861 / JCM 3304 / KCC A-0304 / NBRC 14216 / KM-6054) TaxID=452652 RepID=E4N635_KITSK|nr:MULTISPECIES: NAD(P)-binding domain-containing protein [Kitasatospora]BAJ26666.1 putative oxidoreductase [Kitasatospora setae KM-6054]
MRIGIIGTGAVGQTLGGKLVALGHEVTLGSRSKGNAAAEDWAARTGPLAHPGTFAEAAAFGELVINATSGTVALAAVELAGADNLAGKTLLDVSNPLVFGPDGQVTLDPVNDDSVGERLQRALPDTKVVKALNTVNNEVMVDPGRVPGEHQLFIAGDDADAKARVTALLGEFGWPADAVLDLGGIDGARALEMLMPFWLRLMRHYGHADFNYAIRTAR